MDFIHQICTYILHLRDNIKEESHLLEPDSFCGNCTVDLRFVGIGPLLSPLSETDSSQRLMMYGAHLPQAMILSGSEAPEIGTGFELLVGKYEFNPSKRDNDIQILAAIRKYIPECGPCPIKSNSNPLTTVIYRDNKTGEVNYFELHKYTKGSDGHGYENQLMNTHLLSKDNYVPKEVQFQTSPCHKDNMYGVGLNVKTAYISLESITDDAFVISESLAKRCQSTAIRTVNFQVGINKIPLNLYGNESEYKFMPDIGEAVRSDGILCGFREPDSVSYASDTQFDALSRIQPLHDTLYFAQHPEGVVIDINIYVNKKHKIPRKIYDQIQKYQDQNHRYHMSIIEAYNEAKQRGYPISYAFNTLVTRSYALLRADGRGKIPGLTAKPNITLIQKKDPIEFLSISVTYMYPNEVAAGYKFTGQCGDKGVACIILPDDEMPMDRYGVRADMILDPASVFNRMNPGQLYIQELTRKNLFMRWRLHHMRNGGDIYQPFSFQLPDGSMSDPVPPIASDIVVNSPYDLLLQYFHDMNPKYAEMVKANMQSSMDIENLLNESINHGIYLIMPPFLKHTKPEWFLEMDRRYPSPATSVLITTNRRDGRKKYDWTISPITIGLKYVYCLCKIPQLKSSGPGYINQHKTPIHPSTHAKLQYPISQTPVRDGEDEVRNKSMAAGPAPVARMIALHANSPDGLTALMENLIYNKHPTKINRIPMTTRELINTNCINMTTQHLFSTFGVDILQQVGPGESRYDSYMEYLNMVNGGVIDDRSGLQSDS